MKCKRSYCTNGNYVSWLFYALQIQRPTLLKLDLSRINRSQASTSVRENSALCRCCSLKFVRSLGAPSQLAWDAQAVACLACCSISAPGKVFAMVTNRHRCQTGPGAKLLKTEKSPSSRVIVGTAEILSVIASGMLC